LWADQACITDPMLMMPTRPHPCAMRGRACLIPRKRAPRALTRSEHPIEFSTLISSMGLADVGPRRYSPGHRRRPALADHPLIRFDPSSSSLATSRARTRPWRRRTEAPLRAPGPHFLDSPRKTGPLRGQKQRAIAAPMPWEAPVIRAILSLRRMDNLLFTLKGRQQDQRSLRTSCPESFS